MAIIKHTDLFEFDLFDKSMKEAVNAVNTLGKSVDDVFGRLNSQQKELNATFKQYDAILKAFNISSTGAADGLNKLNVEVEETIRRKKDSIDTEKGLKSAMDATKATVSEMKAEYASLKKQYESLRPDQADYQKQVQAIGARLKEVVPRLGEFSTAVKKTKADVDAVEGSYRQMSNELGELRNKLRTLPGAFDPVTGALNKSNKEATNLIDRIGKLDTAVKAADAAMGIHARNVGNYASGFNGLRNSINQLTREAPAVAVSMSTFFLAISNNIPALTDEINKLKKANVELAADGGKPISIFKQLASAFFSWQTLISVGITVLTLYGAKIIDWVGSLFKGNEAIDKLKESQLLLNEAIKGAEYKKAVQNLEELTINVDLAKKGFLKKKDVIEQYNKSMGETTGQVKTLDEVEQQLVKNGPAYVNMMLFKAAAQLALAKAAGKAVEQAEIERKKAAEFLTTGDKFVSFGAGNVSSPGFVPGLQDKATSLQIAFDKEQSNKRKAAAKKTAEDEKNTFKSIAEQFQTDAAKIASEHKFNFFGDNSKDDKAGVKAVKDAEKILEDSIRRQQALIEKAADLEQKFNELRYVNGQQSEQAFQQNKLDIIRRSVEAQIALEQKLGGKADGSKIAGLKEKEIQAEIEFTKFLQQQQAERAKLAIQSTKDVLAAQEEERKKAKQKEEERANQIDKAQNAGLNREISEENKRFARLKASKDITIQDEIEHQQKLKSIKESYLQSSADEEIAIELATAERKKEIQKETVTVLQQVGQEFFNLLRSNAATDSENRIQSLQNEKDRELALAGTNALAKEKIEKDFQKRINAERVKQAKTERAFAAFQIAINTAQAIARVLAEVPKFDFGISTGILIAAYTALGAIQLAAVLSKPLPKFKTGTKNAPKGPAIVNELGFEIIERNGKMYVAKGHGPTLVNLKGGEKIHTHAESKKLLSGKGKDAADMLRHANASNFATSQIQEGRRNETTGMLAAAMRNNMNEATLTKAFRAAVKEIPVEKNIFDERGIHKRRESLNEKITYLNNRFG